jgi:hypothetical protein
MKRCLVGRAFGLAALCVGGTAIPASAQNPSPAAARGDSQGPAVLVHHALDMAVAGSALQLTARGLASNDAARADRTGSELAERVGDLQADARRNFEGTNTMLAAAHALIQAGQGQGQSPAAAARRYYDVAARYTRTLYTVIGEPLAGSADFGAGTDEGKGKALTATDIATVTLINQAVKEAIDASHLRTMTAHGGEGTANDRLREHSSAMSAHCRRCVEKLAGQGDAGSDDTPTVGLLARQARGLLQILDDDQGKNASARDGR